MSGADDDDFGPLEVGGVATMQHGGVCAGMGGGACAGMGSGVCAGMGGGNQMGGMCPGGMGGQMGAMGGNHMPCAMGGAMGGGACAGQGALAASMCASAMRGAAMAMAGGMGGGAMGGGAMGGGAMGSAVMAPTGPSDPAAKLSKLFDTHPLTGESAFFDGTFYLGFWRERPPTIQSAGEPNQNVGNLNRFKKPEQCRYGPKCRFIMACSRFHGDSVEKHAINCACEDERCPLGHPLRAGRERIPYARGSGAGGGALPTSLVGPTSAQPGRGVRQPPFPLGRRPPPGYKCAKVRPPRPARDPPAVVRSASARDLGAISSPSVQCGSGEHYINECPENTCFKCGAKGHIATNCTFARNANVGNKRSFPDGDGGLPPPPPPGCGGPGWGEPTGCGGPGQFGASSEPGGGGGGQGR